MKEFKILCLVLLLLQVSPVFALGPPIINTLGTSVISSGSVIVNGSIDANGAPTQYYFEYGILPAFDLVTTTEPVNTATGKLNPTALLEGLVPETIYNYRLVASNSQGVSYGSDQIFLTPSPVPPSTISLDTVYPNLGELSQDLPVTIRGSGFDADTRLVFGSDGGNKGKLVTTWESWVSEIEGNRGYLGIGSDGIEVYDISNPLKQSLLETLNINANDIAIHNDILYASYDGEITGYRMSDLVEIGSLILPSQSASMFYSGDRLYITDKIIGLHIIDIDPDRPTFLEVIDTVTTPGTSKGGKLGVVNKRAFVFLQGVGFAVIDVDPESQNYKDITIIPSVPWVGEIAVTDQLVITGNFDRLRVVDADPESPTDLTVVSTVRIPPGIRAIKVSNDQVYLASGDLQIVDISNPLDPVWISTISTPFDPYDIHVHNELAYVYDQDSWDGEKYPTIFSVIDVSFPVKPPELGWVPTVDRAVDVKLDGNTAYIVDLDGGIQIVDVSDAASPVITDEILGPNWYSRGLAVADSTAYSVLGFYSEMEIYDIDPASEDYLAMVGNLSWPDVSNPIDIEVANNTAYIADLDYGLVTVNITDPANPIYLNKYNLVSINQPYDIKVSGNEAYLAGHKGLHIIGVSDPATPSFIGFVRTPSYAYCVAVSGGIAYVGGEHGELWAIDVNPLSPTYLQIISSLLFSGGEATGIKVVNGDILFLANGYRGIDMIDVSDPSQPIYLTTIDTKSWVNNIEVVDNKVYVADYHTGMSIVSVPEEIVIDQISSTEITATLPDPPSTGHYTLRVFNDQQGAELHGSVTFTNEIKLLSSKAIIVAGGGDYLGNLIWDETKAYANYAYDNLIYQGYRHEDITYITDEPNALDRYGTFASFANLQPAIKENLRNAILTWASQSGTSDLLIYMEDHGNTEEFILRGGTSPIKITADELDSWLDTLQEILPGKVILVYDACRSGSFISRLVPPVGKTRITLTSSTPDQTAYFLSTGHSFSSHFWSTFSGKSGNKAIMTEAFARATENMESYQAAQLDANGNGFPNEADDYAALEGHEGTIYALRRQYNYKNRSKPVIPVVSGEQAAAGTNATLVAHDVYDIDGDAITKVWAEIYGPDFNRDPGEVTVTGTDLPSCVFDPVGGGDYQQTCSGFDVNGAYIITYYAEDSSGIYSLPRTSLVTKSGGTTGSVPDQYEDDNTRNDAQVIVVNSPIPQNHSFHVNGDLDWVKFYGIGGEFYNIRAMHPTLVSDPEISVYSSRGVLLNTSNTAGSGQEESINGWQCPEDGLYYVRLSNASEYSGANVRYKLKVYNPIAPSVHGYITGRITSGGHGVAGAILRVGNATAITFADGTFILYLLPGSHIVSVTCDGYQGASFPVTVGSEQHVNLPNVDVNSVPQITNTPSSSVEVNEMYSFTPTVVEPDGDPLSFSITGRPDWANFNSSNGCLSGIPNAADEGNHGPVKIKVRDNAGASDSVLFSIKVLKGSVRTLPPIYMLLKSEVTP